MPEAETKIANNAEIIKKLTNEREDEEKAKKEAEAKREADEKKVLQISQEDIPEADVDEWATNKKESFPGQEDAVDDDVEDSSEFEDETQYEVAARDRSKRNCCYKFTYALVNHPFYNFIVFVLILANTITLALDDYPQSLSKEAVLLVFNDFFTWAFFAEMVIKMIGLGVNNYVHDKFNLFDAIVVTLSLVDWFLAIILTKE